MNTKLTVPKSEAEQKIALQISKGNDLLLRLSEAINHDKWRIPRIEIEFGKKANNYDEWRAIEIEFDKWDSYSYSLLGYLFTTSEQRENYKATRFVRVRNINERANIAEKMDNLREAIRVLVGALESCKEQLELFPSGYLEKSTSVLSTNVGSKKIFIVHGHDNGLKETVARFLEKLDLDPVILHEKASRGNTLIEKFERYAYEASFAVVLFTPDDVVYNMKEQNHRPRQNVIFELGWFIGRLGRDKVRVIYNLDTEVPKDFSDYYGMEYISFDKKGAWRTQLAKEMQDMGFQVDFNKIW